MNSLPTTGPTTMPTAAGATTMPAPMGAMNANAAAPGVFQPRTGKLIFLDNAVQDGSGTVKLRAELPNKDGHFWPGQFVNVRLVLTTKASVLVPNVATQVSQQGLFVYKVTPNDKSPTKFTAMQQPVTVGQRHGDLVVIDNGLAAGDRVVTSGQMLLQPGAPVMVVNAGPAAGDAARGTDQGVAKRPEVAAERRASQDRAGGVRGGIAGL